MESNHYQAYFKFTLQGGNALRVVGLGGRERRQSMDHEERMESQRDWLYPHLEPGREHQDEKNYGKNRSGISGRNHCFVFLKTLFQVFWTRIFANFSLKNFKWILVD